MPEAPLLEDFVDKEQSLISLEGLRSRYLLLVFWDGKEDLPAAPRLHRNSFKLVFSPQSRFFLLMHKSTKAVWLLISEVVAVRSNTFHLGAKIRVSLTWVQPTRKVVQGTLPASHCASKNQFSELNTHSCPSHMTAQVFFAPSLMLLDCA